MTSRKALWKGRSISASPLATLSEERYRRQTEVKAAGQTSSSSAVRLHSKASGSWMYWVLTSDWPILGRMLFALRQIHAGSKQGISEGMIGSSSVLASISSSARSGVAAAIGASRKAGLSRRSTTHGRDCSLGRSSRSSAARMCQPWSRQASEAPSSIPATSLATMRDQMMLEYSCRGCSFLPGGMGPSAGGSLWTT